ncbi:MAG TPA: N-acetylglucosamine-6-phosphate deacetylase [Flexilinea sp.]|nr:N-acetylglucosamine-6-phosphate deacetylase [Flexilinea sp.]HPJ64275.1 N-acetylglucosamine-6-phosphate deacetylase [Flexilinea sp.]HPR70678.1 N-acetylglucosamine-6-phosphate deacetylase [Flexilinea sp.]
MNDFQAVAIQNSKIIFPEKVEEGKVLLLRDGKIAGIVGRDDFNPEDYLTIDATGKYTAPGLIDLHVHGCYNHTFNESDPEAFNTILRNTLRYGITTLVPTLVAAPIPNLIQSLCFIDKWKSEQKPGITQITGAYLESPYIAPQAAGAIPASALRKITDGSIDQILELSYAISIFMIAPELEGAMDAIRKIKQKGIIAAMGHSMAIESEIIPAIEAGASHVTHLWSAMSSVVRQGPWRKPGLLEVALVYPQLTTEIIADNRHLPTTLMKLAVKAKGDKVCAVSDALNGAGLPEGSHFFVGENEYEVVDGVGMVADRSCFAGSTTLLGQEIPILVKEVGLSIPEAIRMVTKIPAKILGIADKKGSIRTGLDADIILLDSNFKIHEIFQQGILIQF